MAIFDVSVRLHTHTYMHTHSQAYKLHRAHGVWPIPAWHATTDRPANCATRSAHSHHEPHTCAPALMMYAMPGGSTYAARHGYRYLDVSGDPAVIRMVKQSAALAEGVVSM